MPAERTVIDGLWRCLCPSVDAATLLRALRTPSVSRGRPATILRRSTNLHSPRQHVRNHGTLAPQGLREDPGDESSIRQEQEEEGEESIEKEEKKRSGDKDYRRYVYRVWKRFGNQNIPRSVFFGGQRLFEVDNTLMDSTDTQALIDILRELVGIERQYHTICNIVRYLVTKRQRKPDAFLYECLVKANIDPQRGSAQVVAGLFKEMESQQMMPTSAIYHGALDVLAVHPDYILRNKIITDMKLAWLTPTFDGLVSITIGLLRDGQYEMALEKLEDLHKTGLPIPPWVYDVFIFTFGEIGVQEETLMILQHRLRHPDSIVPNNIWSFLLDTFSNCSFYEGLKYAWARTVTSGALSPSDGVLLNVLNVASRNGDAIMATSAIKVLSNRGRKLGLHHFEPLLEVHVGENEPRKAFLTMCLMTKAGLQPDLSSTRPLYLRLQDSPEQTEEALRCLHELKLDHQIPVAAFNAVLEASLHHRGFKYALDLYRSVHQICSNGPDLETYNLLLGHCTLHKSMRFLLAEMEAFNVEPNDITYNRVILISTLNPNYESAFRYLDKMKANKREGQLDGWWMNRGTALALIRRCILAEDSRVQELFEECKRRGMEGVELEVRTLIEEAQRNRAEKLASGTGAVDVNALPEPDVVEPVPEAI